METSPTIKSIAAALQNFQEYKVRVGKDAVNPAFKSRYASLASILEAIAIPLSDSALVVLQFPDGDGLTTRLQHISGEYMQATAPLRAVQQTPQALGSALTYARRYALCAMLSLVVDDDDGQAASAPAPAPKLASDKQKNELRQLLSAEELQGGSGVDATLAKLHQLNAVQADKALTYYKQALQDVLDSAPVQ